MKSYSMLLIALVASCFSSSYEVQAQTSRLKVCLNSSTGEIQARRGCRGSYATRLNADNLSVNKIISLRATGSTINTSNGFVTSVAQTGTGLYTITTTLADVRTCTIVASPAFGNNIIVNAYANTIDTSQIFVDSYDANTGTGFDTVYNLLAYCPDNS